MPREWQYEVSIANIIYSMEPDNDICALQNNLMEVTATERVWGLALTADQWNGRRRKLSGQIKEHFGFTGS